MSTHLPVREAPFRFLDLPMELRLMVYEYLPVARIHRKIEDFPTLVVLWSPKTVLCACHAVKEEAAGITNSTLKRYRYARCICPFGLTEEYDAMMRMFVGWTSKGPHHQECIAELIKAVADSRQKLDTGKLLVQDNSVFRKFQEKRGQDAALYITEWVQQAAWLTAKPQHRGWDLNLDIGINFSDARFWHAIDKSGVLFVDAPKDSAFALSISNGMPPGCLKATAISFAELQVMGTENYSYESRHLEVNFESSSRVHISGHRMLEDERTHIWDEDEWL